MENHQEDGILESLRGIIVPERVSVIIPCFNEARTLGAIIEESKKCWMTKEIIVVDDGSSDGTAAVAQEFGAHLVRHGKNMGKGVAIMSGARAAKNSVLVFIDGDLEDFSHESISTLAGPVLKNEARFCKATFGRESGRVTELVAKPLLGLVYPESRLSQPLSGQFCIRKELLLSLDVSLDWGIDISIVLSALKKGEKIAEADIGELRHKHRELDQLAGTAREVTKTILQNAGFRAKKHKLIIFDFDGALIPGSSIGKIFGALGMGKKLAMLRAMHRSGRMNEEELTHRIAHALRGQTTGEIAAIASKIKPSPYAIETLEYLKRMGYRLAIVSFAFKSVICSVLPEGHFDAMICPELEEMEGVLTGKARIPQFASKKFVFSKGKAARRLLRMFDATPTETIALGDSESDWEMFREVGTSVSANPKEKNPAYVKLRSLPELLIIAN
ncbi:MAG: HAD-IB family phosphatase [Candidatus Micrarchaeia archaeon]